MLTSVILLESLGRLDYPEQQKMEMLRHWHIIRVYRYYFRVHVLLGFCIHAPPFLTPSRSRTLFRLRHADVEKGELFTAQQRMGKADR